MSSDDTDTTRFRVVKLLGAENYAEWELSVSAALMYKDLEVSAPPVLPTSDGYAEKVKECRKAFAIIIQSLSPTVTASLSAKARSITEPNPKLLWEELKSHYSASVGAHQAHLLQQMWTIPISEGDDPSKRVAEIQSAHAQINASGAENLSDRMLAYAMTLALPKSFETLKETLWLREDVTSAAVKAGIQAEWTRRGSHSSSAAANAHRARGTNNGRHQGNNGQKRPWTEKWCSFHKTPTHNTAECRAKIGNPNGQANVVSTPSPAPQSALLTSPPIQQTRELLNSLEQLSQCQSKEQQA